MAVEGATGLYLYCWEMFPAETTPLLQAKVLGDTRSIAKAGNSQVMLLCSGLFLLYCTTLPPTPGKAQGLDTGVKGFPFAFLESLESGRQAKKAFLVPNSAKLSNMEDSRN